MIQANIFINRNAHRDPLFKNLSVLEFSDKVALGSCLLISKSCHKTLANFFYDWFTLSFESHI